MGAFSKLAGYLGWGGSGRAYDAGNYQTREMEDWWPTLLSADDEVIDSRDALVARARDLYRNHPVVHGAMNKLADAIVGSRLLLDAMPQYELLRRNLDWALDWSLKTEAEFKVWAYSANFEADIRRQHTFGQLMRTQFLTRLIDGECFHIIRNKSNAQRFTTCLEIIDPDRVSTPNGITENTVLPNGNTVYAGIEYAPDGEPVAYHVQVRHPAAMTATGNLLKWARIPRRSPNGKPIMIHSFRQHRSNQRRGVSALASVIKRVRMNDNYDIAELEAALFDAINAGIVTSPYPTSEVASAMAPSGAGENESDWSLSKQVEYRQKNKVSLGKGVRMIFGLPGEEYKFKQPSRPSGNYPAFKGAGLHDLAAGVGLSYPQTSEDWAAINYSSARTLLNEKWRGFDSLGEEFGSQACSPVYDAWLEEAVAIGAARMPGGAGRYYQSRGLIGFCSWLRPGRGKIDPLKEEQAADIAVHAGRSNSALECSNNGLDFYEVAVGQAREQRMREKLGLKPFVPLKIAAPENEPEEENSRRRNERATA